MQTLLEEYKRIKRTPLPFLPLMVVVFFTIHILGLVFPLSIKKMYMIIVSERSVESLRRMLIIALVALLLETIMRKTRSSISRWIAAKYEYRMTSFLTKKILQTHPMEISSQSYEDELDIFQSVNKVAQFYSNDYFQIFIDFPFMFVYLGLIYFYGGPLVFVPIAITLVDFLLTLLTSILYLKSSKQLIEIEHALLHQVTSSLEKIHDIKAAGIEYTQIRKHKEISKKIHEEEYKNNRQHIMTDVFSDHLPYFAMFMTLVGGGFLLIEGHVSFAQIIACAMLTGRAIQPMRNILRYIVDAKNIRRISRAMDQLVERRPLYDSQKDPLPKINEGKIVLENIQLNETMTPMSLTIPPRSFLVINPKTMPDYRELLNRILGRDIREGERVLIDDYDLQKWNISYLFEVVNWIRGDVSLYKGTVMDNLTLFEPSLEAKAYTAASLAGLDEVVSELSDGYMTQIADYWEKYLSAAFLQRLNMARVFVEKPKVFIFDCIDESMDVETMDIFKWLLNQVKGEITVLLITSNQDLVSADDIIYL